MLNVYSDWEVEASDIVVMAVVYSERGSAPIKVLPSENTSNCESPPESFIVNSEPDNWSSMANNSPKLPCTLNIVEPLPIISNGRLEPDIYKLPVITAEPENGNRSTPVNPLPSPT